MPACVLLVAVSTLLGCGQSLSYYGIGPVHLGMTSSEVSDATKGKAQVKGLRGSWTSGNEAVTFETTPEEDGFRVMKIEYSLNSGGQFADVVANLLKRYGNPVARGSLALGGGACTWGPKRSSHMAGGVFAPSMGQLSRNHPDLLS
jgi:hypothetical protein